MPATITGRRISRLALTAVAAAAAALLSGCIIVVDETGDARYVSDYSEYKSGHRRIGVTLARVGDATASQLELDPDRVCIIEHVYDGTPADRAGLRTHDIVTHIDGREGASIDELRGAIRDRDNDQEICLTILRAGEEHQISVAAERR